MGTRNPNGDGMSFTPMIGMRMDMGMIKYDGYEYGMLEPGG
jgi:hypothetical protein